MRTREAANSATIAALLSEYQSSHTISSQSRYVWANTLSRAARSVAAPLRTFMMMLTVGIVARRGQTIRQYSRRLPIPTLLQTAYRRWLSVATGSIGPGDTRAWPSVFHIGGRTVLRTR